jgi:hypothetical protein
MAFGAVAAVLTGELFEEHGTFRGDFAHFNISFVAVDVVARNGEHRQKGKE